MPVSPKLLRLFDTAMTLNGVVGVAFMARAILLSSVLTGVVAGGMIETTLKENNMKSIWCAVVLILVASVAIADDPDEWIECARFQQEGAGPVFVALSPDGEVVALNDKDGPVRLFRSKDGSQLGAFTPRAPFQVRMLNVWFSPDSKIAAVACIAHENGTPKPTVAIFDALTGTEFAIVQGISPVFSADSKLFSTILSNRLTMWDASDGKEIVAFSSADRLLGMPVLSKDGQVAVADAEGNVHVWEIVGNNNHYQVTGYGPVFAPDGSALATVGSDNVVTLRTPMTGTEILSLKRSPHAPFTSVQFSPDGKLVATSGDYIGPNPAKGSLPKDFFATKPVDLSIWDAHTGERLAALPGSVQGNDWVLFSPDGRVLAYQRLTGSPSIATVVVWDIAVDDERFDLSKGTIGGINHSYFLNGGKVLLTHERKQVRFWEVESGSELKPFIPHKDYVAQLIVSEDSGTIVTTSESAEVKTWRRRKP